jgi:hypothetical protein
VIGPVPARCSAAIRIPTQRLGRFALAAIVTARPRNWLKSRPSVLNATERPSTVAVQRLPS